MRRTYFVPGCKTCFLVAGDEIAATIWPHPEKRAVGIAVIPADHHNHVPGWIHPRDEEPQRAADAAPRKRVSR